MEYNGEYPITKEELHIFKEPIETTKEIDKP
jgi:hypothetical protein